MERDTILELLRGIHFDMPQRISKGIWPHPPLRFGLLLEILANHLTAHGYFPDSPESGPLIDAARIHRTAAGKFIYTSKHSAPINPQVTAHECQIAFNTAEDAANYYLHWVLHLPGDLDGWKVLD